MTKCEECGEVFRADHIIEEVIGEDVESLENEELRPDSLLTMPSNVRNVAENFPIYLELQFNV